MVDSFEGIPAVNVKEFPADALHAGADKDPLLKDNSMERVQENFRRLGLLDDSIVWLKGWFKDTLPAARQIMTSFAVARLDGDTYESTWQALTSVYDKVCARLCPARACFTPASVQLKGRVSTDFALELGYDFFWGVCAVRARANKQVSVGGFVIMDDYFDWTGCRTAVDDFRSKCAYFACVLGSESKLVVMFFRYCAIPLRQYDDVLGDGRFKSRASCETSNRSISVLSLQGSKSDSRYLTDGM